MTKRTLWIGSYTPEAGTSGRGGGIYRVELDTATGILGEPVVAMATPNPSWIVRHPLVNVLLAVAEQESGEIRAFTVGDDLGLESINSQSTSGSFPCHIGLSADGDTAIVSNYGDGMISTHRLSVGGVASNPHAPAHLDGEVSVMAHSGSGPDSVRQEGPHAHSAWLSPARNQILSCDLGTDELRRFDIDEFGRLTDPEIAAKVPAGSGPRHLVVHNNGFLYLNGELDSTIVVLRWDSIARRARQVQVVPTAPRSWSDPDSAINSVPRPAPSHLELDSTGRFLYSAVRGVNQISVHSIGGDGRLDYVGEVSIPGVNPRHFAIIDDIVVVANQDSDSLSTLRINPASAMPIPSHEVSIASPSCVVAEPA